MDAVIEVEEVAKTFVLHGQGGAELPVLRGVSFRVEAGEALMLSGASGTGKSTLLRLLYANYLPTRGRVLVRHADAIVNVASAPARLVLEVRRRTLGFVSQFLRVIPRVATLDVVREPMLARGRDEGEATRRAKAILDRLSVPERLWRLPPATFSGGEQQRVNVARALADPHPVLLLDEPTASLDAPNRDAVAGIVEEARAGGCAVVGIFHDEAIRARLATRTLDLTPFKAA